MKTIAQLLHGAKRLQALLLFPAVLLSGSIANGDDLTVWFSQSAEGVRITIGNWHLPDDVNIDPPVALMDVHAYQVSTDPATGGVFIRYAIEGDQWYGVTQYGEDGGTIDFSKLKIVDISAQSFGADGGVRLSYSGGSGTDMGVFAFEVYDEISRVATFDINLLLPGISLNDLFVTGAFDGGAFTVWQSDSFSVNFALVPEPAGYALLLGFGALAVGLVRQRRRK